MITMIMYRRMIVGHIVITRVKVPQVLWSALCGSLDGWGRIPPVFVWPMTTYSIRWWELKK